jgi:hypothetical protein
MSFKIASNTTDKKLCVNIGGNKKMDEKLGLQLVVEMSLTYESVARIVYLQKTVLLIG